jgi:DNA-binding transcriptional MerR regulator
MNLEDVSFYSPGQTADKSGFSLDTLRYYEKIGLLGDIGRTSAGWRRFSDDDLAWLGVLRCLRETGMPIAEMLRYAELARDGDGDETFPERITLLEAHDQRVEEQIAGLRAQQRHIQEKIRYYRDALDEA